jgi:hypothetical protein
VRPHPVLQLTQWHICSKIVNIRMQSLACEHQQASVAIGSGLLHAC